LKEPDWDGSGRRMTNDDWEELISWLHNEKKKPMSEIKNYTPFQIKRIVCRAKDQTSNCTDMDLKVLQETYGLPSMDE
jgi:hypothetical protein